MEGKTEKKTKFNLKKNKILKDETEKYKKEQPQKIHGSPDQTYYLDHEMRITWMKGNQRK